MWRAPSYLQGVSRCQTCRRSAWKHGDVVRYDKGKCRCDLCKAAKTASFRDYAARRAAAGKPLDWDSYRKKYSKICPVCGKSFLARKEVTHCSRQCNSSTQLRNTRATRLKRMTSEGRAFRLRAEKLAGKAAKGKSGGNLVWVQGRCPGCGEQFLSPGSASRYCSLFCRAVVTGNKNVENGSWISRRGRLRIYNRDGWACQICGSELSADGIGDLQPTLDHIVPRSKGGSHDPSNLRMACRRCNVLRGDLTWFSDEDVRRAVSA